MFGHTGQRAARSAVPTVVISGIVTAMLLLATACSEDTTNAGTSDAKVTSETTSSGGGIGDGASPGDADQDVVLDCPGGTGCPCAENADCDSTICTETSAGSVCAQTCIDSCPTGFICKAYAGGGGDGTNICVPRHGRRCDPCNTNAQCQVVGQESARCVLYGVEGNDGAPLCTADITSAEQLQAALREVD